MTFDIQTQDTEKITATLPIPEADQTFNWKNCWYPIAFLQDLPKDRPYSFSLYDEPLVLFTNQEGKQTCLIDRCPHRAAKLSDGQIIDGKIECLYHGWQFGADGQCLHIPQLPVDAKIPATACVQSFKVVERQGILWMWRGEPEVADDERIPTVADLDKPEFVSLDYLSDRPYDQTYFIENIIDPAHLPISHHGSMSNRENAQPLDMEVLKTSVEGIQGRVREKRNANGNWVNCDFVVDRFKRHTQICSSCNQAYQVTKRLKQGSVGVAIALAALAIITDHSWLQFVAMSLSLSAVTLAVVAQVVKTKFEDSYKRS